MNLKRGTLASRLYELQKLLGYLPSLGTDVSGAAAKAPKRKRDDGEDKEDPGAGKGPSQGAEQKRVKLSADGTERREREAEKGKSAGGRE